MRARFWAAVETILYRAWLWAYTKRLDVPAVADGSEFAAAGAPWEGLNLGPIERIQDRPDGQELTFDMTYVSPGESVVRFTLCPTCRAAFVSAFMATAPEKSCRVTPSVAGVARPLDEQLGNVFGEGA